MTPAIKAQPSFWEDQRLTLQCAIDLSVASLAAYGQSHKHWCIAYSGGKDSSATVSFVVWAIQSGRIPAPDSLTVLYADTRQELPSLNATAMTLLTRITADGFSTKIVLPKIEDRFYVYMFGRGVPPPSNRFRWCTPQLKIEPMAADLQAMRDQAGEKLLMITGVRLGESAVRDQRIALSCSKDSGECGQGWFQVATDNSVADTLAPLLHWRLCHVWDWLFGLTPKDAINPYSAITSNVAVTYGDGDIRTGCIGCNLASRDNALEYLISTPEWANLTPLMEIKPMFAELKRPKNRLRKSMAEIRKDGAWSKNAQRLGPLTFEARRWGLATVKDIQARAGVDLINAEEEQRILELIDANTWPNGWSGEEIVGDVMLDSVRTTLSGELAIQPLLLKGVSQ